MTPVLIDTATAHPRDAVGFWRDAASRVFQPLDVRCEDPAAFWAHAAGYELCDLTVTRTRSQASTVVRTERGIAELDPDQLMLVLHVRGRYRITQGDHSAVCGAGDLAIFDSARPFVTRSEGPIDVVTLAMSKAHVAWGAPHSAVRIPGGRGAAALVAPFLLNLLDGLRDGAIAPDDEFVADGVVGLVRALFSGHGAPAGQADPLREVKRWIDAHLGEEDLTPARIAAAHYMSRRRLYTLFAAEPSGVAGWIRARRLERCRRDLRDPARGHETVTAIAARWGFGDASHFSHRFRDAYGVSPRAYRAAAIAHAGTSGAHA